MSQYSHEEDETAVDDSIESAVEEFDPPVEDDNPAVSDVARIVVKRAGIETEDMFEFVPPAVIGRFDPSVGPVDIDLGALPEGSYVSRKHAKFTCHDGVWKIEDLGSSNGTYVLRDDFEKVDEAELHDGTEFTLGNARFVFRVG